MSNIMLSKIVVILSLSLLSLAFTGCQSISSSSNGPKETNLLGIVKVQPDSYTPSSPATFTLSTDELSNRKNYSGDKTTLLWGLITLKDY